MSKIRTLAVLVSVALASIAAVLSPATPASAAVCPADLAIPFSDVAENDPFCREIMNAYAEEWVTGYDDGTFRPLNNITRAAAATMIVRAYGNPVPACVVAPFTDVPTDHPYCAEIAAAKDLGFFEGWPDGTFRPSLPITRQAVAAAMIYYVPTIGLPTCDEPPFTDVSTDHWLCSEILFAVNVGIVEGYPDGSFRPTNPITRQAFVAMLGRAEPIWVH